VLPDTAAVTQDEWRRLLGRRIGWSLALKLLALLALKSLFFSGDARVEVTPGTVDGQLKVATEPRGEGAGDD
jgi:hypothetical protein